MGPVRQAMSDAGLKPSDLAKVLMVGGSSRIPAVQEAVKSFTGKRAASRASTPMSAWPWAPPCRAGVLTGDVKGLLLLDVTPLSLGIETMGGVCTQSDRPQHHHPCEEEPDLLHRRRQPDLRGGQRPAGRA